MASREKNGNVTRIPAREPGNQSQLVRDLIAENTRLRVYIDYLEKIIDGGIHKPGDWFLFLMAGFLAGWMAALLLMQ